MDVHKQFKDDISKTLFYLCNSNIDFLPRTMLKEDETTGWLASDHINVMKIWSHLLWNVDSIIENKFKMGSKFDVEKFAKKMRTAHLTMHNIMVPDDLNNQRIAALNHKESMLRNSNNLKNIKFEPLICSSCMLAAQIKTSDKKNAENIKIYTKLHLNELCAIDFLCKKITNYDKKIPMWLSQYKNLNLLCCLPRDIISNGNAGNYWDRKEHGEKGTWPVKNEFVTKRTILLVK